jgi:hypothetical protein
MDVTIISALITIASTLIFSVVGYLLVQRDNQRKEDIKSLQQLIRETAALVLAEKEKTAALVLSESRLNAALVLSERERLEVRFKTEYDSLDEKLTDFRIMVAEKYATSALVEKILQQVTAPITKKLDEIETLLGGKVDRREFDHHMQEKN